MSPFLCPFTSCPVRSSSSAVSFCSVSSEAVLWRCFFVRARLCLPSELAAQILSTISPPPLRVPFSLPPSPLLSLGALGIASLYYSGCQLACDGLLRFLCQLVL